MSNSCTILGFPAKIKMRKSFANFPILTQTLCTPTCPLSRVLLSARNSLQRKTHNPNTYIRLCPKPYYFRVRCAYSFVASKLGHALLAKSLCPRIVACGYFFTRWRNNCSNARFCASVRVSFGLPSADRPPM